MMTVPLGGRSKVTPRLSRASWRKSRVTVTAARVEPQVGFQVGATSVRAAAGTT